VIVSLRKIFPSGYAILAAFLLIMIASGLFMTQSLWIAEIKNELPPAPFSAIDLVNQQWVARQGFSEGDAGGFNPDLPGTVAVDHFPILLNALFKVPPGNEVNDFSLMVKVSLGTQAESQNLMLSLPQIGDNWAVYLNGVEIQREMALDENGQIRRRRAMQNVLIPIPQRTIQAGVNTFVFHIKGFAPTNQFFSGWQVGLSLSTGYQVGLLDQLIKTRTLQDAFAWMQMGVYFFFGLLQFFLFFRQREIYSFYFSLFLISCAVYSFAYSNVAFIFIPDTAIIYRMMFGANFIWPGLVGLTLWSYLYPGRSLETWLKWLIGITLLFTVCLWLIPFGWAETLLAIFLLVTVGSAVFLLRMITRAARDGVRDARKILVSGCIIFVLIIWTVVDLFIFRTGIDIIGWTPFFLAVAFALIFIDRLWKTTIELFESNRQISLMRDNMESQVILRTSQLRGVNTELEKKLSEINALQENLREMALHDALTGLYNRRFLVETLDREFALIKRNHATCLVMIDIDHFKFLNDSYGHKAGDQVLKEFSAFLVSYFRQSDLIFRFGGEEFLAILPEARLADALWRTDQMRTITERLIFHYDDQDIKITISAGIAEMVLNDISPDRTINRADLALYTAKEKGRNRVEAADEPAHI
jgi:diguanylate cyclase (GGDEF)-like protein